MKKTLFVTALFAALSGVAHAETSVTLYGLIDTGIGFQRIKGNDAQYASKQVGRLARASTVAQPYAADYALANLRVERQWDDLRFVSSTGYVRNILTESYDATQPDTPSSLFRQHNRVSIFSTENRLVRDLDNGLGWLVGVSYLESRSDISRSPSAGTSA